MKKIKALLMSLVISGMLISVSNSTVFAEDLQLKPDGSKPCIVYPVDEKTKSIAEEKQKLAKQHMDAKVGKISKSYVESLERTFQQKYGNSKNLSSQSYKQINIQTSSASSYYNNISALLQQPQVTSYYCGPATACEILGSKSINLSQNSAASSLGTTSSGTDWYNGKYPMQATLNSYEGVTWYVPYGTSVDATTFQNDVVLDIDDGYGVAGDAWEVPGGPHLVGHPTDKTIYHWFAIDGYTSNGSLTHYADSVYGANSISWSSSVPKYSNIDTNTLARIVNGRGIIW